MQKTDRLHQTIEDLLVTSCSKEIEIRTKRIVVPKNHRPLNNDKLPIIAASMAEIGLKTPISVRKSNKDVILVAGRHRLEAAKSLGWARIPCLVMDGGKVARQLWTIAENLHRAGLTRLQRAELVDRWDALVMGSKGARPGGQQPHDKGISRTAKALGKSRDEVRRSKKIAALSPDGKEAVVAARLDNDEGAMLEVAKIPTSKGQTKKARAIAKSKRDSRRRSLFPRELKELKALKKAYAAAIKFKSAWKGATAAVRKQFITAVLMASA